MPVDPAIHPEALRGWQKLLPGIREQFKDKLAGRLIEPGIPAGKRRGSASRRKSQRRDAANADPGSTALPAGSHATEETRATWPGLLALDHPQLEGQWLRPALRDAGQPGRDNHEDVTPWLTRHLPIAWR